MINFLDWLGGPGGNAQGRLEKQFGMPAADARRAAEALGPAYLLGLQRLAGDVDGWASLIRAVTPGSTMAGALPSFFGTDALTQAVASEAARQSGLPKQMLAAMMPTLAAMTVEAVMRMATPGGQQPLAPDMFGAASAEMLRRTANAVEAFSRPAASRAPSPSVPFGFDPFQLPWMKGMMPGASVAPPTPTPAPVDTVTDPFRPMAAFMAAFTSGLASQKPEPPTEQKVGTDTVNPFLSLVSAGQDAQADYVRNIGALFTAHGGKERGPSEPS